MADTAIRWTSTNGRRGKTWNAVLGCSRVSPGCGDASGGGCYAERLALRYGWSKKPWKAQFAAENIQLKPHRLRDPYKWKEPVRCFVNSLSDVFHEQVPDEYIDQIFQVMADLPQHTFMLLTKRPGRMRDYMNDPYTPHRVARVGVARGIEQELLGLPYDRRPLRGFPSYSIDNRGVVFSTNGSTCCCYCGTPVTGQAHKRYCSEKCRQISWYHRSKGKRDKYEPEMTPLAPNVGEHGHCRVTLYRDGPRVRPLVSRLVLETFVGPASEAQQACHRDGNPRNNALPNLRWGSQSDNWNDRREHGNYQTHVKLTRQEVNAIRLLAEDNVACTAIAERFRVSDTQVRNILYGNQWSVPPPMEWPPVNCWLGTSVEDQRRANERIPLLLETPAACRFLSCEPLLGPVDLSGLLDGLAWVIVGGESGPGYRPMDHAWARAIRDQCVAAGVAYYFKQSAAPRTEMGQELIEADGTTTRIEQFPDEMGLIPQVTAPIGLGL